MSLYEYTNNKLEKLQRISFADKEILERDLQKWLQDDFSVI